VLLRLWRWKVFVRPKATTIRRIKERKGAQRRTGLAYADDPRVSVIVQSFNQVRNVPALESGLRRTNADELIVCEDGSIDGSDEAWRRRLVRPNDFLLHSNDIHEIRAYDRAISFARGEFICLMQDDDRPPHDGSWLARAIALFENHPGLAVLGCWCGFNDWFDYAYNAPWLPAGDGKIPYADPRSGTPMMFVENVNIGPYLLRRSVYHELGGFDHEFSPPGQPGITFESEFCYRAWVRGYQVALIDVPVKLETGEEAYILPGGTSLWGMADRVRNEVANKQRIEDLYADGFAEVQEAVNKANRGLVEASCTG
jgi:glycosyltransferase involved in cell wall biosynthesis